MCGGWGGEGGDVPTIRILWCYSFDPSTGKLLPDVSFTLCLFCCDWDIPSTNVTSTYHTNRVLYPSLLEESGPSWAVDHLSSSGGSEVCGHKWYVRLAVLHAQAI